MKGILVRSLLSCTLLTTVSYADTLVPAGSNLSISSATNDSGPVVIGGNLQTQSANVIAAQSPVYLAAGGSFNINNLQQSVGSISGSGSVFLGNASLPADYGLVKLGGGKLAPGSNSGFSDAAAASSLTVGGATVTSGGSLSLNGAATFSGGMLQYSGARTATTDRVFVMSAAANNTVMGSSISVDTSNSLGGLIKIGSGTLTLTGSNTYTGSTTISAGTLALNSSASDATIVYNVAGGVGVTALMINPISVGNITVTGTGTINLNGLLRYSTGLLTIKSAAVISSTSAIGKTLDISSLSSGSVMNSTGGTMTIAPGGWTVASGDTLTWTNTGGVMTFSGTNGVIGSTAVSGSFALTFGTSETVSHPSLDYSPAPTNGTLITGNDNTNRIFSGVISGTGSVIKVGTGLWNLTGANTYTGLTTVANGGLIVNGSIPGDVFVWGGILGGSGQIGGSVLNQSVVSPGNSPGTLTIAGDYAQSASGYLLIQLASPIVYDKLVVGGQANLDGGVAIQFYNGFRPKKGESFTFLTAAGGVTGEFSHVIFPSGTLLWFGLEYDPNSVTLDVLQGSFAKDVPNLTPNELAVAKALDKVINRKRVSGLIDELDGLQLGAVPNALEKIAPTNLLSIFDASIASATVQADNLERRMEEIRDGSTGFSSGGLHLANSHGTLSGGGDGDGKQAIGKDGKELAPAPLSDRWGFFINGTGEFVDVESTAMARGTDFTTGGISTGADYRLGDHAAVGVTAGYANTATDSRSQDSVKTNSGKLGLYGTVFDQGFFVNGGLGGGLNNYDTKRETVGGNALGDATGNDVNALLGTGYTYRKGAWSVGPIASMRYSWVGLDSFTEHGSLAPLQFPDQSESSLRSATGVQTSYAFKLGKITITPQVRAQWQHEYLDATRGIGASFLPGGSFNVFGPNIGRDSLLLDAGVTVQLTSKVGIYAFYTGDLGSQNYSAQSVNGGVQVSF